MKSSKTGEIDMSENTVNPVEENNAQESGKTVLRAVTFGGFNRTDVLDFIERQKKIEADLKKKVDELQTKLNASGGAQAQTDEALQAELAAEKQKVAALERENKNLRENAAIVMPAGEGADAAQIGELTASLEDARKEKSDLEKMIAKKDELLSQYAEKVAEKDGLLSQYAGQIAEKDAKIDELNALLAKPAQTGSCEAQIGAVLLDARRCADEMIASAKLEESRIRAQAYSGIEKTKKTVQHICDELEISFERYQRNALLAKSTMDELNEMMDSELDGFSASASDNGENVE